MENLKELLRRSNIAYGKEIYNSLVVAKIREKYSQDEENAILRKKLANIDFKNEFEEYNTFVENIKQEVKTQLGL